MTTPLPFLADRALTEDRVRPVHRVDSTSYQQYVRPTKALQSLDEDSFDVSRVSVVTQTHPTSNSLRELEAKYARDTAFDAHLVPASEPIRCESCMGGSAFRPA